MKKFIGISVLALSICALAPVTAVASSSLLIVHADPGSVPTAEMTATGRFSSVGEFNASGSTPALGDLTPFDYVLAYTNYVPANGSALGDVLADYVDGGGRLVVATYGFSDPWAISGRVATAGYSPLVNVGTNGDVSGNVVAVVPDPIFTGIDLSAVTYLYNSNFAHPGVDTGATLLATDGAGINMIAVNDDRSVFGFNFYPGMYVGGTTNAEFYNLLANAFSGSPGPVIPAPAAIVLGSLGAGLVGWLRRRRAL